MKWILMIIFLSIIAIGTIIIKYIFNFNKIQSMNIKINESENIIDNKIRKKYDLITRSSSIISKLLKKKISYFK